MRIPSSRRYRASEIGIEARCSKCSAWWPADKEFFYCRSDGTPHSWCKACYEADRQEKRKQDRERQSPAATGTPVKPASKANP